MSEREPEKSCWWVYLIRTNHNSLYCGITNNLNRRIKMHQQGKGAKYLRGKGPLTLEWSQALSNKSMALKLECRIKKLSKKQKETIVISNSVLPF